MFIWITAGDNPSFRGSHAGVHTQQSRGKKCSLLLFLSHCYGSSVSALSAWVSLCHSRPVPRPSGKAVSYLLSLSPDHSWIVLLHIQCRVQPTKWCLPYSGQIFPPQITIKTISHRHCPGQPDLDYPSLRLSFRWF